MVTLVPMGYGVTDENGVAKLDHDMDGNVLSHSYTGVGAGRIDLLASIDDPDNVSYSGEGTLVSEIYGVLDCLYIDKCTSSDHANWNSTTGFTWSDGKCTITVSSSSFLRIVTSIVGDFEATFKAKSDAMRLAMYNASNVTQSRQWNMYATTDEVYYKINRVGSTWTAKTSTDGTNWTNLTERSDDTDLTTEDVYFGFIIATSTERSITYTDLKVYPI